MGEASLELLSVNTIRALAIDVIQKAKSGHPGLPLGAAPMTYALWQEHLNQDPTAPAWPNRDRFVLSPGHGSALLYTMLHLWGFDLTMDDLKSFRQWGSKTPGHPEFGWTTGVEATTGPLGQGSSNAVGMAMAERSLARHFNREGFNLVDHYTYAIVSDGDLMEGISAEASSFAGHMKLGKLIYLYDANDVTLDGPTSMTFSTENVAKRYESYGWQVLTITDGDTNIEGIKKAISEAKADTSRPSIIIIKTTIGYGSPNKQGTCGAHGSPLGPAEIALTKTALGLDPTKEFFIPEEVRTHIKACTDKGVEARKSWESLFSAYEKAHPELAKQWHLTISGELPAGWDAEIPSWKAGESVASRVASGKVINGFASKIPWLIGGDADLSGSTQTTIKGGGDFDGQTGAGTNVHYGIREHAMAGMANGMAYHGQTRAFVSTFFCFADYMRPSIRLAALSHLPAIYVFTHDSVVVGEDGPTHQPVEHLMSLRAIPNVHVVRPADPNETAEAWRFAMKHRGGPVAIVLTRQNLPVVDTSRYADATGLHQGAYVVADAKAPQAIIMATGSELSVALAAHESLAKKGVPTRVVSMPCWEAFAAQSAEYKESVLPSRLKARVAVEAGVSFGWHRWVGIDGAIVAIDRFGASAPGELILEQLGLTAEAVEKAVVAQLK